MAIRTYEDLLHREFPRAASNGMNPSRRDFPEVDGASNGAGRTGRMRTDFPNKHRPMLNSRRMDLGSRNSTRR